MTLDLIAEIEGWRLAPPKERLAGGTLALI